MPCDNLSPAVFGPRRLPRRLPRRSSRDMPEEIILAQVGAAARRSAQVVSAN